MKAQLIAALETICPNNVFLQGTVSPDAAYPESFITFWTNGTDQDGAYDDSEHAYDWSFTVNYYSSDPANVNSVPATIRTTLKAAGFMPQGKGFDIPSDVPTHTGWTMDFVRKEYPTS